MNLKNSKFFKRIQELRHFSKEKIRKDREQRTRVTRALDMALSEQPHRERDWYSPGHSPPNSLPLSQPVISSPRRRLKKLRCAKKKVAACKGSQSPDYRVAGGQCLADGPPLQELLSASEAKLQGYIQLNNKCYRVECPTSAVPTAGGVPDDERTPR